MTETETNGTTTSAVSTIAPELQIVDGHVTTTSLQIAEHFGKIHRDVVRAVENLECSADFRLRNFAQSSFDAPMPNGGTRKHSMYRITRQGFSFLAMGFTGKEAAQWKEAYIETFDRMEAALTSGTPDRITPAQAQHLKELVDIIVASGKQDYPSTWARFQRKFKVNEYKLLHPSQFDAACEYLRGKMDGQSMAALVQKHFPDAMKMVPAPAQQPLPFPAPVIDMERIRQTMIAANEVAAKVQAVVFFELLNGQKNWQNERWCLSFVVDGRNDTAPPTPRAWQIESDAVIAPLLKLASDIGKEGGILLATIQDLLALNSASSQALSRRLAAGVNVR